MAVWAPVASRSDPFESYIATATWPLMISGSLRAVALSRRRATAPASSGWAASSEAGRPAGSRVRVATEPPVTASASVPAGRAEAGQATRSGPTTYALDFVRSGAAPGRDVLTEIACVDRTYEMVVRTPSEGTEKATLAPPGAPP